MTDPTARPATVQDDPKRPYKAYLAAAGAFGASFLTYWAADKGAFTGADIREGLIAAALSAGVLGGGVFGVKNPKKPVTRRH